MLTMNPPQRRDFNSEGLIHRKIFRPLAQELMILLWSTGITPNGVTLFRLVLFLPFSFFLVKGEVLYAWIALALFFIMELLDHLDGMLARAKGLSSRRGQFYELISDELTSSPTSLFGLVLVCASPSYSLLPYYVFAIFSEKTYYFCLWNFNYGEPKILKEIDHDSELVHKPKNITSFIYQILTSIFIWKPIILVICYVIQFYINISFVSWMYVFITLTFLYMAWKRINLCWRSI